MSARAHATLSASGAHRWLACTPSALLEAKEPESTSSFADEGTLAHEVAEAYLVDSLDSKGTRCDDLRKALDFPMEMEDHAETYAEYVASKKTSKDSQVDVEARLDFSRWVPGGFGTGDCVILQDGTLSIIDYKYGKGVRVDAQDNPQMMLYALGAMDAYDFAFEFDKVEMCIYQPRLDHISEWVITRDELLIWAEKELTPRAALAAKGKGKFCAGEHCRFCRVAKKCKALADHCTAVVASDFENEAGELDTKELTPKDYELILSRAEMVKHWLSLVEETSLNLLLEDPEAIPNWKVVEGRSNRKYADAKKCAETLLKAGLGPDEIYKPQDLLGITDMTKLLGKKRFEEVLGDQIVKPQGKPTVVPTTDKRPVYQNTANDFEKETI